MKIELIENTEFGFYNIKFGSKPDYEHDADMLNELKANGWAWSRHNGVWYPRTTEAKAKANTFAAEFAKKYNEPDKSFGQELFERTQRIDQWKNEHLLHEHNNEPVPVQEEAKPVELNDKQKKVYELLKATNNFSENQILEMVSKIDTAYQTENFDIPELSWEEIKSFIHADDSFDLAKDLRDLYNPNISESYNKINVVYNYLHDLMDFDVLGENQYERSADEEYHTMRESIRHDILQPVCENIVMGRYSDFFDMQEDFISRREEKIADISKSYMENPAIKEQYIGIKRAELIEKAPEMLKGREFNSWIFNVDNDGHFLFYESNGYLKSEYLNDDKYNAVKDFLSQVEELDLLEESSKQLKEEYAKMHSLLEKPPVQIQEELIAREVEEELANADEEIDTSISEYNDLGIDTRTGEPWNGEESEDFTEPETQEEESTELTQTDLDNATKVIPENQYQFMLENAAGEEAEYFKQKLKNMATICADLQKHSNKENVNKDGSHPCKLHYFLGNCDWYISELDNDGIGFGYCILNGDLYSSEWGSVNVCGDSTYEQPLTKMAINVPIRINGTEFHRSVSPELDLHLDEDTIIERELYKLDNEYFAEYKKYAEKDEKILAKSSEVSINIIEETNQELEVENGSKTDIGYERRAVISSGGNLNQGLEEPGAEADRGSDSGRGQRVLHSEKEENGSLENSEGIPELHTVGREFEISDLHIEEGLSGNNEILHSERSSEAGNSDLQHTGMENGQIPHRVRTVEPGNGTGVNPNENTSSEPLHGNEEVIEKEADKLFKKITEQYDTQYKDFYDTYNKMKESYTENESRYVSDARIGDMFRQVHRELVSLQMNELTDLIKQAPNADIARINATRYINFCGQDEFNYLHDNLYIRCHLGDYTKDSGRKFVAPTSEELQSFINETYNSLHGIVAEKEIPVYNINGTDYTQETIETLITEDIQNVLNELNPVPVIEGVRLYQNPEQTGKVNILLQYNAKENETNWREDDLFNAVMVENLTFNGMAVDVNPITPEKSGTIEQYLEHFESLGVTNENEAIVKQAEMLDEQFDFAKLADDICQQSYEQSGAGFNYYIYFEEIAGLAGKDVAWVKENIEKIGEALEEHNDELLLDFNLKEALEEYSLELNFCSVGEDTNELFKKDDSGRWVRKTDRELAIEQGEEEPYDPEIKVKPYDFFINDVANLDLGIGAEIDPITGLSAEKAALKYAELKDKGLSPYIGINIPGDFIFDDKEGQGAGIFVETNEHPSFYMGDNFVKDLNKKDEHAKTVIAAYKELYAMTDKYILGVQRPDFVFEKEKELFGNQETHSLTNGTQSFEMSFSNKDVEALKERYEEAKEDIKQNMGIDNSPKPDNPPHTLSWEELELDPEGYETLEFTNETEFKEKALSMHLENELDSRGFDSGLEGVSNEDNSAILEQKWAIIDDISHRIVFGELKYEPHNYDYSNQQKEYDRLLKSNPVFQELTNKGVIKADFDNPFVVSAEEKKEPLPMLTAEDVKFRRDSKEELYSFDGTDGIWYITEKRIADNIYTYQLAFKPNGDERTFSSELARNNWLGISSIPSDHFVTTKNKKEYFIYENDKDTFRIKEYTNYIPYGNVFRNSKACRDEAVDWIVHEENKKRTEYNKNLEKESLNEINSKLAANINWSDFTEDVFSKTKADLQNWKDGEVYASINVGQLSFELVPQNYGDRMELDTRIYYPKLYATYGEDADGVKYDTASGFDIDAETFAKMSYEEFKDYFANTVLPSSLDKDLIERALQPTEDWNSIWEKLNKENNFSYMFPEGFFKNSKELDKYEVEYEGTFDFGETDGICQVVSGDKKTLEKIAADYGYELHPDYLYHKDDLDLDDRTAVHDMSFRSVDLADAFKSENIEVIKNLDEIQIRKKLSKEQQQALDNIRFIKRNDTMMRVLEEVELNRIGGKYNSFAERLDHIADVIRNTNSESLVAVIANIDFSKYETNPASVEQKIFDLTNIFEFWERGLALNKELENSKEQTISKEPEQLTSKKDIKAIREQCREILQKPDSEITEADKAILAQYEGAGGIKEDNRTVSGILNEFYTPNNLVEKVWQIVDAYAPDAKTVLEPSAGVGKFANNRPNNEFTMHELDETSARINKILHPEANVIQGAYQKQFFDAGERIHTPGQKVKYDVVIGNPPYGTYNDKYKGLGEGKEFDRYEEYFISKGLDALKDDDSRLAFVVPSGFLNSSKDKQKEIIASKGHLIDAYRLPEKTFPTTEVGTDIIILKKWKLPEGQIYPGNAMLQAAASAMSDGKYFEAYPEKILGEVNTRTNRVGKEENYVSVHKGLTIQEELNKIDSFLKNPKNEWTVKEPEKLSSPSIRPQPAVNKEQTLSQDIAQSTEVVEEELDDPTKRLYEDPDGIFKTKHQLTREEFAKFYTGANFTQEDYNIWGATDWKGNVDTSKLTETELSYLISSDNYVKINEGVYTNAMLYATGNIYQKLDELEENKENLSSESYEKAKAILTNAIPKVVPIENIKIDALSPLAQEFKVHREVTSSRWYMGRTELQTVELDIDLREDFINWATNCSSLDNFDENNQSINSRRSIYNYSSAKISREDIPEDISWTDIVNYIDRVPVPTHIDEKNDTKEVKNKKNLIAGNIKDARKNTCYELFNRYIQEGLPQEDKERLQNTWNKIYNATVHADYKKLPLFIDGMSTFKGEHPFMLYKQQVEGVSRLLSKGNGLLAYEVGVGKTAAGIVTTMGQLQTGRCRRPLIIVPNQVYKKWVKDFRELFPDVKINELYNLSEKYIDKHFDERTHSLLIEPGSVTIITDSALQKITFSDAVCSNELAEDFSYLLGVSDALHSGDDKEKATAYQKIQNEIGKASRVQVKKLPEGREERIQQSYIFFDECGFDNVVIDEAHRYKNLFTVPRPKRGEKAAREFEGLGTGKPSIRAEKVFGITTLIQRRNEDRNVFLLTATPFTNNPLEVYSMLSFMGRKELINRHIYDVRDFCTEFAQTKFEYAVKPSGEIEPKQVMKNFRGQKKLKNLVFEYIDAVSAKEAGIERPEGERHPIYLELSPLQQRIIKLEQDAIAAADNPYVTLKAMTTMRTCTLSPALLDPADFASVEDIVIPPKSQIVESSPKLSWVCNTVADLYKQKPKCGQFIYMPQGKDCFDEVKNYLIKQGIPDDAIDYIHSTHNGSAEDKDKISARFNNKEDKLKILIGTATVAEGIDLNGNSIVEYNTMLGWNPTESIQVEGRIWRQGNEQGKVHIMYPLMENSIDALIYQKHDEKASRINSVLSKIDDGKDAIDTDEINPETIKFELITDPEKKIKMIIDEKTAEKRKEIKVIENRLETIQELEEDRKNCKTLYDTNVAEKEKYKSLLKTAREELKADPNNWQKEARVTSNERAVYTCNKEIAKSRNRLNTISYNFNKFDIHEPEREVPIKLQELATKKAELEADISDIVNSKDRLIADEQKKLLEKKILSKPVEELRREWVEYVNKNTWYKKQNDKSKDRNETVQEPLEAVKDFKVPDVMIKNLDKAMAEMDFKVLHNYLNWGDRDIISDSHENDKAIVILRERYEKTKGVKLPEQFRKTTDYLVSVCDEKTLPEVCKFKSMEEAVAYACSSWHGEAYQRDGYVEYVTLDNFKKNRDVSALAKDLQKREGQSYLGHGSPNGFGYDCSPKGVKIEAFINKKREEFFVNWNQVAKIKAKQWNREYPAEFTIKDEPERVEEKNLKNVEMVQQDLFDFDEVKVQTKTLDIRMQGYNSQFILSDQALSNYRGLPPFIKKSDNEWIIRCKGEDFSKPQEGIASYELIDISLTKEQLQGMVKAHLFAQQQEISHKKFDDPEYKGKVICPKPEVSDMQKELLKSNGISDNDLNKVTKENFNELLCEGEKPILKKKLPQQKQLKQENNQKLFPDTTIEITEDTDFDYDY